MFTRYPAIQCWFCKYEQGHKPYKNGKVVCEAFPDGIPNEIYANKYDHRKPYEGDNNIQFEWLSNEELQLKFSRYSQDEIDIEVQKIIRFLDVLPPNVSNNLD